jgi:hypothetical protein
MPFVGIILCSLFLIAVWRINVTDDKSEADDKLRQ